MARSANRIITGISSGILIGIACFSGCTTAEIAPPSPPEPPAYTKALHPNGLDLGELDAIFVDEKAPKDPEFPKICDQDYRALKSLARSKDELEQGIKELVRQDPMNFHWCFYSKLKFLEDEMRKDIYLDERQKLLLSTFEFLVPIAKAFNTEFHDSRYYRWAVYRYKKLSEWVFFRKLELTPEGTSLLVQPTNPFGLWRDTASEATVLEKYRLTKLPRANPTPSAPPTPDPYLLPTPAPSAEPTPEANLPPVPTPEVTPSQQQSSPEATQTKSQ